MENKLKELTDVIEKENKKIENNLRKIERLNEEIKESNRILSDTYREINALNLTNDEEILEGTICTFTSNDNIYKCKLQIVVVNEDRYDFIPLDNYRGFDIRKFNLMDYCFIEPNNLIRRFEEDFNCKLTHIKRPCYEDRIKIYENR